MLEQIHPKIHRIQGYSETAHPAVLKKIVEREQLELVGNFHRNRHRKMAFTSGTYDMIHVGHVRYLELARSLGDVLIVGLNSDKSVKAYKDPTRPILGENRRAEMLAALSSVDFITLYDETTADEIIRILRPDAYLCVEGSWAEGTDLETKAEVQAMLEHGGEVFLSPRQEPGLSTSAIIAQLEKNGETRTRRKIMQLLQEE